MPSSWIDMFGTDVVVLDGGLSTQLESRGHAMDDPLWTGRVLVQQPEEITHAHRAFVHAGARVVVSASYQVSRAGFVRAGMQAAAADAALLSSIEAARAATIGTTCLVAASVGPYGAILHDGSEYRGRYGLSRAALIDFHADRLSVLAEGRPDLLAVETIPDVDEGAALAEVLAAYPGLPAWMTFSASDDARTCAGQPIEEAVSAAASAANVVAVGINCTDPVHVSGLVERMRAVTSLPIIAYPNVGGVWNPTSSSWDVPSGVAFPSRQVDEWRGIGVAAIGGCCGTDAGVIAELTRQLAD
jgi:homocysteine S-methyltransferase